MPIAGCPRVRNHYWIVIKHLVLNGIEWILRLFYFHRHDYTLYLQPELKIMGYVQPATLEDPRGCTCRCKKCGKSIHFFIVSHIDAPM